MFSWDEFDIVLFEHGLSVRKQVAGSWTCESSSLALNLVSPLEIKEQFGVRPVVVHGPCGNSRISLVLPFAQGRFLDIYRSELATGLPRSVAFVMGAMLYHCKALAGLYADMVRDHVRVTQIPGFPVSNRWVTSPEEPFFEFEALVTAVVRGYEYLTIPLWKRYGTNSNPPRKFSLALARCLSLPADIGQRLRHSHDCYFARAKEYRDCIQHNIDLGSSSWAMMEELRSVAWSVIVRVPDNPGSKSRRQFVFDQNLDALSLGWELVTELFAVYDILFGSGSLSRLPPDGS